MHPPDVSRPAVLNRVAHMGYTLARYFSCLTRVQEHMEASDRDGRKQRPVVRR